MHSQQCTTTPFITPLALCIVFLSLVVASNIAAAEKTAAVSAIVAKVEKSQLSDPIEALGTAHAREMLTVTANIADKVTAIHFEDGQQVQRGQLLVELDSAEEAADLRAATAVLEEREKALQRVQRLVEQNLASQTLLDEVTAEVLQARAQIDLVRIRIENHRIRAPFTGQLGLRNISIGSRISPGDIITTLDDLSAIKLDFSIPATFLAALQTGLRVNASTSAFSGRVFSGRVTGIDTRVDPVTRSVLVRATIANPDFSLKPGMLLQVTLLKNPRQALTVPEAALIPQGQQQYVMVIDEQRDKRAERRPVVIGQRLNGRVEIAEGLTETDWVIVDGAFNIQPGTRIDKLIHDDGRRSLTELLTPKSNSLAQP